MGASQSAATQNTGGRKPRRRHRLTEIRRQLRRSSSMPAARHDRFSPSTSHTPDDTLYVQWKQRISDRALQLRDRAMHKMEGGSATEMAHLVEWSSGRSRTMLKSKIVREQRKGFRDLLSQWTLQHVHCLVSEYDSSLALRSLCVMAERARPSGSSIVHDMRQLCRSGVAAEATVVCRGRTYPVHLPLVCQRSTLFSRLFASSSDRCSIDISCEVPEDWEEDDVMSCLEYIYCGESSKTDAEWTMTVRRVLGIDRSWEDDMSALLHATDGDTKLVFTAAAADVPCYSFILAARCAFFRCLLARDMLSMHTITLDEEVIPRVYAPVLMHALYTDEVHLDKIGTEHHPLSSLSQVQAIANGHCSNRPIDMAERLFEIAAFLDCAAIRRRCEELIVEHCTLETASHVYTWASDANASPYARRYVEDMVTLSFHKLLTSPLLAEMEEELLVTVLRSDFVQASELDILLTVVRWGECTLLRRMEERVPDVLYGTTRRGVKKSDMNDVELRHILRRLLPLVRTDFILPPYHKALVECIGRGLLKMDTPNASAYGLCTRTIDRSGEPTVDQHWLHTHLREGRGVQGARRRPRVYLPYVDEAHAIYTARTATGGELPLTHVHGGGTEEGEEGCSYTTRRVPADVSIPSWSVVDALRQTAHDLQSRHASITSRVLQCQCDYHRSAMWTQLYLQVLREEGHPDDLLHVLQSPWLHFPEHVPSPPSSYSATHRSTGTVHDPVADERPSMLPDVTNGTPPYNTMPSSAMGTAMQIRSLRRDIEALLYRDDNDS